MYFTITPFIYSLRDKNLKLLNKLNELILNLSNNINDKNYYDIIIFLQKNKFDSFQFLIIMKIFALRKIK